jgi:hypothetical protein
MIWSICTVGLVHDIYDVDIFTKTKNDANVLPTIHAIFHPIVILI